MELGFESSALSLGPSPSPWTSPVFRAFPKHFQFQSSLAAGFGTVSVGKYRAEWSISTSSWLIVSRFLVLTPATALTVLPPGPFCRLGVGPGEKRPPGMGRRACGVLPARGRPLAVLGVSTAGWIAPGAFVREVPGAVGWGSLGLWDRGTLEALEGEGVLSHSEEDSTFPHVNPGCPQLRHIASQQHVPPCVCDRSTGPLGL